MDERSLSPVLGDLHLLTVLAETRSYTQAALRLGISKASASARISELERAAGVQLVRRTSRSVALTDAGHRLVEDIAPGFLRIADGFGSTKDDAGRPKGLVRVTAPVALGRQRVMPLVPQFLALYPEIRLELELTDRLVNLQQEGFDLAIRHTDAPPETHVAWQLCTTRTWLVASEKYLQKHGEPEHPSSLSAHVCLPYLRGGGIQRWMFEKTPPRGKAQGERIEVPVAGSFKANNSELLREAVLAGVGIGLLPDFSCIEQIKAGTLKALMPRWRPVGFFGQKVYAIRPFLGSKTPRAVQCFVETLKANLPGSFD